MRSLFGTLLLVGLLGLGAATARAQTVPALSEEAQVSLLTILPGEPVYSAWGHTAFRVYDPALGIDWTYNYGTFAFDRFFVFKFAYGKLDYFLSVNDFQRVLPYYARVEGRPTIEQVLDLSPAQKQAVFRFLQLNALPENRVYRYDFFFDNCATRPRDVLEQTLGDAFRFSPAPPPGTFRDLIDPYLAENPFLDFGLDLLLGSPTDRAATPREAMFLPVYLMDALDAATVEVNGTTRPLVARRDTLTWVEDYETFETAFPWPSLLAWGLFAGALVATLLGLRRSAFPTRRWPDVLLLGVVGAAGLLMAFMWGVTLHHVTGPNWNLLWAWPTHLVAAWALARRRAGRLLFGYLAAATGATLLAAAGWLLWPQELPPALLPLLLLLALRLGRHAYALRHPSARAPIDA